MESITVVPYISVSLGWKIHQMEFKSVYFDGDLQEEIYMDQPNGLKDPPNKCAS